MKKIAKFNLIVLLVLLFAASLTAQNNDNYRNFVRSELERTDQLLERTQGTIGNFNSPAGNTHMKQARNIQDMAWKSFHQQQYVVALSLTKKAREQAKQAVSSSRQIEQYEGILMQKLERAGDLLERAGEIVKASQNENLETIYEIASDNLTRAWEFYRAGDYKPALKLVNQVTEAARKILEMFNKHVRDRGFYERHRENINRIMEQAREQIAGCENANAQAFMEQASAAFKRSEELAGDNQFKGAFKQLQMARELALKASRECQGQSNLMQRYEKLKQDADRLAEHVGAQGVDAPDNARKLLEQLNRQLELSKEYINKEQTEPAVAALKAAQLIMEQLQRQLQRF